MNMEWPELEDAIRRKDEDRRRELSEIETEKLLYELEARADEMFRRKSIEESLSPHRPLVDRWINDWKDVVRGLLVRLARASCANGRWEIRSKVIDAPQNASHSLYWEVIFLDIGEKCWFTVELVLDPDHCPSHFLVECGQPGYYLTAGPSVEALKMALVQAYEIGQAPDLERVPAVGLPF